MAVSRPPAAKRGRIASVIRRQPCQVGYRALNKWRANECTSSIRTICGAASKASHRASARHAMDAVRDRSDNSFSPSSFTDPIAVVPSVAESPAQTFPSSSAMLRPSGEIACQVNSRWTVSICPHLAPFGPVQCIRISGKRILGNARYAA